MNRIRVIFKREYLAYFRTPIGFVLFAIFMAVAGLYFASAILANAIDMVGELSFLQAFLFIIIPLLTMRIFSEERKNGTEILLLTSPASSLEIVLAKYLASLAFFLTLTTGTLIHVTITMLYGGVLDANVIGAYIGFILLGAVYIAIGVFASALTENQMVAALITFISITVLTMIEYLSAMIQQVLTTFLSTVNIFSLTDVRIDGIGQSFANAIAWLNPKTRINHMIIGIFEISSLIFFLSLIAIFLFLTNRVIEKRRWSQK
jgi:ABC-2 type transport system permease protein